jgi:hypothetical protein
MGSFGKTLRDGADRVNSLSLRDQGFGRRSAFEISSSMWVWEATGAIMVGT